MKVSFIEYCMYKYVLGLFARASVAGADVLWWGASRYKKTLAQLFEEKPKNLAHLLKALDEAIELHQVGAAFLRRMCTPLVVIAERFGGCRSCSEQRRRKRRRWTSSDPSQRLARE